MATNEITYKETAFYIIGAIIFISLLSFSVMVLDCAFHELTGTTWRTSQCIDWNCIEVPLYSAPICRNILYVIGWSVPEK